MRMLFCWPHSPAVFKSRTLCWTPVGLLDTTGWWSAFTVTATASRLLTAGRCQSTNMDAKYPFFVLGSILVLFY